MERYNDKRYQQLTAKQYIQIKLDKIKRAKKMPFNNAFGGMAVLELMERTLQQDLNELLRHEIIDRESLR